MVFLNGGPGDERRLFVIDPALPVQAAARWNLPVAFPVQVPAGKEFAPRACPSPEGAGLQQQFDAAAMRLTPMATATVSNSWRSLDHLRPWVLCLVPELRFSNMRLTSFEGRA